MRFPYEVSDAGSGPETGEKKKYRGKPLGSVYEDQCSEDGSDVDERTEVRGTLTIRDLGLDRKISSGKTGPGPLRHQRKNIIALVRARQDTVLIDQTVSLDQSHITLRIGTCPEPHN